jgi:lipoate-protein ligase A
VTNIREHVPPELFPDMQTFWSGLIDAFAKEGPLTHIDPPAELLDKARFLQETKYQTWEWNFGNAPAFQYHNTRRYPGGNLEIDINVENGLVSQCRICGDFLGLVELDELESSFVGLKFSETEILQKLKTMDLSPFLGSITAEEVVDCMFVTQ